VSPGSPPRTSSRAVGASSCPPSSYAAGSRASRFTRDAIGVVHQLSAVCSHLGCIVHWDPTERSWDCPRHGSRFDARGHVVHGPAHRDLTPIGGAAHAAID
jgi:Rieske Fe-S protein